MRAPRVLQARVRHLASSPIVLLLIIFVLGIVSYSNRSIIVVVDINNYRLLALSLLELGQ
jgi:hypothetical protein